MESNVSQALYPLHQCKTIHLVRHGQGIHNIVDGKDPNVFLSEELFDPHLTPFGWQQLDALRKHVHSCGLSEKIDLVITSPMLRTLQTAVGAFGGESHSDDVDATPLMVENAGNSTRPAISSLNCQPFVAVELCRERLGVLHYERRRSVSEYKTLFPAIDFSLIESDGDVLWKPDKRETYAEIAARAMEFFNWLWTRKEKEIVVVTHCVFLFNALCAFDNCYAFDKTDKRKWFDNCELRSFVLVDRSMVGSESSNTNYCGEVPNVPDLPSDATK